MRMANGPSVLSEDRNGHMQGHKLLLTPPLPGSSCRSDTRLCFVECRVRESVSLGCLEGKVVSAQGKSCTKGTLHHFPLKTSGAALADERHLQ